MARPRDKQHRYQDLANFSQVLEHTTTDPTHLRGSWSTIFGNHHPIVLELACGKGDYTLALAKQHPEKNFLGVDIKGARLWIGARYAEEHTLSNVRFLRTYIDHVDQYFLPGEVDEIWITFPDPHGTKKGAKKRLTAPRFLRIYQQILKPNGTIHLKTDDEAFFDYSLECIHDCKGTILQEIRNIYACTDIHSDLTIKTFYEQQHLKQHKHIHYVCWKLPVSP